MLKSDKPYIDGYKSGFNSGIEHRVPSTPTIEKNKEILEIILKKLENDERYMTRVTNGMSWIIAVLCGILIAVISLFYR